MWTRFLTEACSPSLLNASLLRYGTDHCSPVTFSWHEYVMVVPVRTTSNELRRHKLHVTLLPLLSDWSLMVMVPSPPHRGQLSAKVRTLAMLHMSQCRNCLKGLTPRKAHGALVLSGAPEPSC
jgi:hypothetical protein